MKTEDIKRYEREIANARLRPPNIPRWAWDRVKNLDWLSRSKRIQKARDLVKQREAKEKADG